MVFVCVERFVSAYVCTLFGDQIILAGFKLGQFSRITVKYSVFAFGNVKRPIGKRSDDDLRMTENVDVGDAYRLRYDNAKSTVQ